MDWGDCYEKKIIIIIVCMVALGIGTFFIILKLGSNASASTQQIIVTNSVPLVESSAEVGALFPKNIQITYTSFAPVISEIKRSQPPKIGYLRGLIVMPRTYQ